MRPARVGSRLALERPVASHQGDPAGPSELLDSVGADLLDKRLDLLFLPGDLDHQLIRADVENPAAKDLHQGVDLGSKRRRRVDLDQHQVALDVILARDVVDLHDRHDLLELLSHLVEMPVVSHHDHRDPREQRVLGLADRQALDIEPARRKHPRDVRQHARLVLHQRRKQMTLAARIGRSRPIRRAWGFASRTGRVAMTCTDGQLPLVRGQWSFDSWLRFAELAASQRLEPEDQPSRSRRRTLTAAAAHCAAAAAETPRETAAGKPPASAPLARGLLGLGHAARSRLIERKLSPGVT